MASIIKADLWQNTQGIQYNSVIQVQTSLVNERSAWSSPVNSETIITPLSIAITPRYVGSKIVVQWMVNGELHQDNVFRIYRNGIQAPNGRNTTDSGRWSGYASAFYDQNESSTPSNWSILYFDTPNTLTQQTYSLAVGGSGATAYTFYLNRTVGTAGSDNQEVMVSSVIAWEVVQ